MRKDRVDTAHGIGGGLIVYIKIGLTVLEHELNSDFNQYNSFKLYSNDGGHVKFVTVYKSPNSDNENIDKLCELVQTMDNNTFMIGDFNFPGIRWNDKMADSKGRKFLNTIIENNIHQAVEEPTHIKGNILDLVLTKNPELIVDLSVLDNLSKSDHNMILLEIQTNVSKNTTNEKIFDWNKADFNGIKNGMSEVNWKNEFHNKSASEMWATLKSKIDNLQEKFVPRKNRRSPGKPPWMNKHILTMIRKKRRLYKVSKSDQTKYNDYVAQEKQIRNAVRKAKKSYEKHISKTSNSSDKKFYSYVKSRTKVKTSIGPLKDENGETHSEPKQMAEILNNFFSGVFTREDTNNIPEPEAHEFNERLEFVNFTREKVMAKIDKLKNGSAPGNDKIEVVLLKAVKSEIAEPLTMIYTKSFQTNDIPADWKDSNITPVFKKGSKSNPSNHRPLAMTPIPCKIMESIIKDDIVAHLEEQNLIRSSQHGFTKNKSCATNLLEFFEKVCQIFDEGDSVDLIYLDYAKAFDKVPFQRLIVILKAHGINGNLLKWIENWISGRRQRVVLNGVFSEWIEVLSGVPQGSILGPILFIIFINDIDCKILIDLMKKFADDTKGAHKITSDEDRKIIQTTLDNLFNWSIQWGMEFNKSKCKVMHIGRKNPKFEYFIDNVKLQKIDSEKDLGILTSSTLKPSQQCQEAARKANFVLNQTLKAFHYRDKTVFLQLYKRYIRPHLEFSTVTWNPWTAADVEILEQVQKRAVNSICGLNSSNYADKLKELKITSLEDRRTRFDMIQVYKILNKVDKVEENIWFTRANVNLGRVTRLAANPLNLKKKRVNTDVYKNFFSNRVIDLWNNLPDNVKSARNLYIFKKEYDKL